MNQLTGLAISLGMGCLVVLWVWWATNHVTWPDSLKYISLARGERVSGPFVRRYLLPWLLGPRVWAWRAASYTSIIASAGLLFLISGSLKAPLLFLGLYGLVWMSIAGPVLVDMPAFALSLLATLLYTNDHPYLAGTILSIAAGCKESAPFFVAAWTGEPRALLVGFGTILTLKWAKMWWGGDSVDDPWLQPIRKLIPLARRSHDWTGLKRMILPWGALAILFPVGVTQLGLSKAVLLAFLSLGLGYAQLLIASDEGRLYQWAAPAVILVACQVDGAWVAPLLVLHLFNPYRVH